MIDLHCHVLPGIDDGPGSWEESLDLVREMAALGTRKLVATSHVSPRYPNTAEVLHARAAELGGRLAQAGIAVEVLPGAEIAITRLDELPDGELEQLGLGGTSWLLLESPFTQAIDAIVPVCELLVDQGHLILLAHPERCPGFQRRPELLHALQELGVRCSVTANALVGGFGREVARFARWMAVEGLIDNVASDAHGLNNRRPGIREPLEQSGISDEHIEALTQLMPQALLSGGGAPARLGPLLAPAPERWWRRWS